MRIDADGTGEVAFAVLIASVDHGFTRGVDFDWNGAVQGNQISGAGWAHLQDDDWLEGEVIYDDGEHTF